MNKKEYWIIMSKLTKIEKKIDEIRGVKEECGETVENEIPEPVEKVFINGLGEINLRTRKEYKPEKNPKWPDTTP